MKFYIVIALTIFSCACVRNSTNSVKTTENKIFLEAIEKGNYSCSNEDSTLYTLVEIRLVNNTDSECKFIANSCATGASFITNSEQVKICLNQCSINFPKLFILKPGQEFSIPVILQISKYKSSYYDSIPLRIGMVLIPHNLFTGDNFHELLFKMKRNNDNILWCDLSNVGGDPYEVK